MWQDSEEIKVVRNAILAKTKSNERLELKAEKNKEKESCQMHIELVPLSLIFSSFNSFASFLNINYITKTEKKKKGERKKSYKHSFIRFHFSNLHFVLYSSTLYQVLNHHIQLISKIRPQTNYSVYLYELLLPTSYIIKILFQTFFFIYLIIFLWNSLVLF